MVCGLTSMIVSAAPVHACARGAAPFRASPSESNLSRSAPACGSSPIILTVWPCTRTGCSGGAARGLVSTQNRDCSGDRLVWSFGLSYGSGECSRCDHLAHSCTGQSGRVVRVRSVWVGLARRARGELAGAVGPCDTCGADARQSAL